MDCRINKEFNPQTCRYVKECKPGQVRDKKFRCKSIVRRVYKSKSVSRHKLKQLKVLVNSNTSLTPNNVTVKSKSSRATKTVKSLTPSKLSNLSKLSKVSKLSKSVKSPSKLKLKETKTKETKMFPTEKQILNMKVISDPETVFMFYSKSTHKLPGKGAGEKISNPSKYVELSKIKDWRKQLSNFWMAPFNLDGRTWGSVEHYYQASKFKNSSFYNDFSLDSGTEISKDPGMAKAAGGKTGRYKNKQLRPKTIKVDDDFFGERQKIEMFTGQYAKFTQHPDLMKTLELTKDATLLHYVRGETPVKFDNLMFIRNMFSSELQNEDGPATKKAETKKHVAFKSKTPEPESVEPVKVSKRKKLIDYINRFKPTEKTTLGQLGRPAIEAGIIENTKPDINLLKELVGIYFSKSKSK